MDKSAILRFREIVKVLGSYGFGYVVENKLSKEKKSPENLRKAFEQLGPTFVKIGQILSTRPDIIPPSYIHELSKLQDDVPPEKYEAINNMFFSEFNKNLDEAFLTFEKKPIASASIAQVHKAILISGKEVIVKIQRPKIEEQMKLDIYILKKLFKLTKAKLSDSLINPEEALDELLLSTEKELNFTIEINNMKKFNEYNKEVAFLYCPFIVDDLCSKKVITMEKINGFKIDNIKELKSQGFDLEDLSRKFILSFFKQIFEDNFFHGDPHPGNVLISNNKICFIDFGIVGTLTKSLKDSLNETIVAFAYHDIDKLISILMSIGIKKGYINKSKLFEDIDYLFSSYASASLKNIKVSTVIQEVFDCAKRNNIQLPKDLTLLIRSLVIVEGVVAKINPDLNLLDVAIPYVKSKTRVKFLNKISFDEILLQSYRFTKATSDIPSKFIELSDSIIKGRAKVQLQIPSLNKSISQFNRMVNRIVFSLIISSMIIGSSLILNSNIGPKIYNISIIGLSGYLIAAILGFWLLISIIKSGKL